MAASAELDRVFRIEARELLEGLARGLLELERSPERTELIHHCFRLAHTLKGAARVAGRPPVAELAHAIEDALAPYRGGEAPPDAGFMGDLLALVSALQCEVADAPGPEAAHAPRSGAPAEDRLETVRVEIAELDATLEAAAEAGVQLGAARRCAEALREAQRAVAALLQDVRRPGGAQAKRPAADSLLRTIAGGLEEIQASLAGAQTGLGAGLERTAQELADVHQRLAALRLVPARAIMPSLELAARDAAEAAGLRVDFSATGEEVRLEGHILAAVRDALLHLVRNAIAHGVEPADERARLGKAPAGRVRITVERRGPRAVFTCADDGRGMDVEALRAAAVRRGLISAEQAMTLGREDALRLALRAGVSTSEGVTELSGRGVGLDVAAETAARFDGELRIDSAPSRGTTIELEVALSLSSLSALAVVAGATPALIPLTGVQGVVRLEEGELLRDGSGASILHEGRAIPFAPLAELLGAPDPAPRPRWSAVIVRSGGSLLALGVDRLLGSTEVMVKPLPLAAGEHALIAGATLDAQGDPLVVLDPRGLLRAADGLPALGAAPARAPRLPLLIIDDSLTTRMLERSILEGAGYEVDLAGSGEEGLEKAKRRRYGLFIVDVEMPGMSGLDFLRITREDPDLHEVPVIIVTSLASADDRRRGLEAGAAAYIVKGEFDQRRFVGTVGELTARNA